MTDRSESGAPVLLYDGDCGFCRAWVEYWSDLTGDAVRYCAFDDAVGDEASAIARFGRSAVLFVDRSGRVSRAAEAAFTALGYAPGHRWQLWAYRSVPGFGAPCEAAYRLIAKHRNAAYRVTKLLWGIPPRRLSYAATMSLFLRLLGVIYLIAFVSFGVQAAGLIGRDGILPLVDVLPRIHAYYGVRSYWLFPTLLWLNPSDAAIAATSIVGALASLAMTVIPNRTVERGRSRLLSPALHEKAALGENARVARWTLYAGPAQRLASAVCFVLYLSLVVAGQDFMGFQWDGLLLEAGFLALLFGASRLGLWLQRWLLFRLMFMSGMVKLLSGDPTWRSLTALRYHFETQPLPTPLAWYMQQLPGWALTWMCAGVFVIELAVPFLIFFPRRARLLGAVLLVALQVAIFITGNYAFFNLLTILLCLTLLDDQRLARWESRSAGRLARRPTRSVATGAPASSPANLDQRAKARSPQPAQAATLRRALISALAVALVLISSLELAGRIFRIESPALWTIVEPAQQLRIVNSYGLFASMTTSRPEIVLEGSSDGEHWSPYRFRWKPGPLERAPRWVEPHQPRLDWQMWFAALGNYRQNPWTIGLVLRILEGSPAVLGLMDGNPFPNTPPKYVRALVYDYHFTTWSERRASGNWWKRQLLGQYLPPLSLEDLERNGIR